MQLRKLTKCSTPKFRLNLLQVGVWKEIITTLWRLIWKRQRKTPTRQTNPNRQRKQPKRTETDGNDTETTETEETKETETETDGNDTETEQTEETEENKDDKQ